MLFSKALFYPTIDIHDEEWLKTAFLFWDEIRTIVPQSLAGRAYQNNTSQYLEDVEFLKPYFVNPDSSLVKSLLKPVMTVERGDGYLFQMVVLPLKILRKRWLK